MRRGLLGGHMGYRLGVDLGTTYTAAASVDGGEPAMLGLGIRALQVPSVVYVQEGGAFLVGEAAERRGAVDPTRVVREFKRRLGDSVPIMVAGAPYSAQALTARLLGWVLEQASEQLGEPPDHVTLTHPANWGEFKLDLLRQAAALADLRGVALCPEPVAAAAQYAARSRVRDGDRIAVYDLGGGTFDVSVLAKTPDGFRILGPPEGIEHLGGIEFDAALFQRVLDGLDLSGLDRDDPDLLAGMARLRRDCVEAKEALSSDVDADLRVTLPGLDTTVRVTRAEFEDLIRAALQDTLAATRRALGPAGVTAKDLSAIVLVGGSSRIPLVTELLAGAFPCPVARDTHPKHDVAMGAARSRVVGLEPGKPTVPRHTPTTVSRVKRTARRRAVGTARRAGALAVLTLATAGGAVALAGDSTNITLPPLPLPQSVRLPDDQMIVTREVEGNVDLYLVDVTAGQVIERLSTDPLVDRGPVLSADRRSIVYVQDTGEALTLRVMAANGDGDRLLFRAPPEVCASMNRPAWSPISPDLLAIPCREPQAHRTLRLIRLDGQIVRTFDSGHAIAEAPAFSPDGSTLAYWASDGVIANGGSIFTVAVDGSAAPDQLTDQPEGTDSAPVWSPDGEQIAFRRRIDNQSRTGDLELFIMDADGSDPRALAPHAGSDSSPTWSPDGTMIAFTSKRGVERGRDRDTHIWVVEVNVDGAEPRLVFPDDGGPALYGTAW